MKNNKLQKKIKTIGIVFTLLFSVGILSVTTANAQYRDDRQDRQEDRQ